MGNPALIEELLKKEVNYKMKRDAHAGISDYKSLSISPEIAAQQMGWQIQSFDFPSIWSATQGENVKVAVLDTGVAPNHPDLEIKKSLNFINIRMTSWWDSVNEKVIAPEINYDTYSPTNDHGTHVCGIIGAENNDIGVVGVAPKCDIYALRVLNEAGSGYWDDIEIALLWCLYNEDIDVINMSLGGLQGIETLWRTINKLYKSNIPIICSAGNEYLEPEYKGYLSFPAQYDETISVASLDQDQFRSYFSSVGPNLDLAAPGRDILSTLIGSGYGVMSGTSMSAPFVTGLATLAISKHKKLGGNTPLKTVEDLREHLAKTALDDELFDGKDIYRGYGLVRPNVALDTLKAIEPLPKVAFGKYYGGGIIQYNDKPWILR